MMPELDPSLLDFRPMDIDFGAKRDDPLNWNSQVLSDPMSVEVGRHAPPRDQRAEFDEDDMNIDLDLDLGLDDGPSIEIGRKATSNMETKDYVPGTGDRFSDDLNQEGDIRTRLSSQVPSLIADDDEQVADDRGMLVDEGNDLLLPTEDGLDPFPALSDPRLQRDSQSPLSSARSSLARELGVANLNEEELLHQAPHRAKKRKVIQTDADTMIPLHQLRQQETDKSAILKPPSFLPRDPLLLNLMNMQKNGGFVTSIMGDDRAKGWAPDLRGILSIEVVKKSAELKRKRDSGVADVSENEAQADIGGIPQLEIPEEETYGVLDEGIAVGREDSVRGQSLINLPADDGYPVAQDDTRLSVTSREDDEDPEAVQNHFDETTAPLLYPMEQGAVSQGTKHAVHLLRDRFGPSADNSQSQQRKVNIFFQDLLPESVTSKADATKMFFEVLVLATKDAVKVEQASKDIGSQLRIRAKRGLWGAWAEKEAGGEIAQEEGLSAALPSTA